MPSSSHLQIFAYSLVALTHAVLSSADTSSSGCVDSHDNCNYWSTIGECEDNPDYMQTNCNLSCNTCTSDDIDITITKAVGSDNQDISKVWWVNSSDKQNFVNDIMNYMKDEVWSTTTRSDHDGKYAKTKGICTNQHDMCTHWAMQDRCNEIDVKLQCGPSCRSCLHLDENVRCGGTIDQLPNVLEAGSLGAMFERIVKDFNPTIYSQPTPEDDKPWIITIDNFVTDGEIDRILQYGTSTGYQQSFETFQGNHGGAQTTQMRTSENSWCGYQFGDKCFDDPIVKGFLSRVQEVTHVPIVNYNEMQILRYQPGQYYKTHGDYIVADAKRRVGGRILTFFLYFSDVDEGGETEFPRLDPPIKVTPKKGTALLWANVKDDDPHTEDTRMWHQALPVVKGKKHAANLWINMRDTRTPIDKKCSS